MFFNPFDRLLKKHKPKKLLVVWNRGMGDVPLGLYALVQQVKRLLPTAEVTFLTRADLAEVFSMLEGAQVIIDPTFRRGVPPVVSQTLIKEYDLILDAVNPTKWFKWQLKRVVPKLVWNPAWDVYAERFGLNPQMTYVGAHVSTETGQFYGYEKNWPEEKWRAVMAESPVPFVLFGKDKRGKYENAIDLRGETTMIEMLSIIKQRCRYLLAPDSGILSVVYYVDAQFPLKLVSLWADPKQGVLRQGVRSPNEALLHIPLIGKKEKIATIGENQVLRALFS